MSTIGGMSHGEPSSAVDVAPTELIVVCCHAVFTGEAEWWQEAEWLLQKFQQSEPSSGKRGEHETFTTHIQVGVRTRSCNPASLLVFSGGKTTTHERSEAAGYAKVLAALHPSFAKTCVLEELATDSYQNLLFSIIRFKRSTGTYPQTITVVTHAFKERRFLELHGPAIKWPRGRIRVQGVNPPFTLAELNDTIQNEREKAFSLFAQDPYGTRVPLANKRLSRNWKPSDVHELDADEAVRQLLEWTGGSSGDQIFPGRLPWEDLE